ncbi:hypothetical protein [Nonomuraea recticatena]|uniref:hypothetical protein n=1 Tax=Nonomuraea recticatena TaxID=46178 RepID=UPI00360C7F13
MRLPDAPTTRSRAAWPIAALLVGYPVWWALGFGGLAVIVLAFPMAYVLWRRRPIRVPRGLGLWALLLAGYVVSALMLTEMPPDTYGEFGAGRIIGYVMRLALYLSLMVMVLYLGNLTERELPQLRLVRMLGVLFLTTVAGGLLGVLFPSFAFTSPLERVLPGWIGGNPFVQNLIHPTAAQIQKVLGHASPRPEAPFEWANAWGSNLSVLLVWFVVGWWVYGGPRRKAVAVLLIAAAAVPVVYSLNRGLWIGLGLAALYLVVRVGGRTRLAICAAGLVGAAVFAASPWPPWSPSGSTTRTATTSEPSPSRPPSRRRAAHRSSATATPATPWATTARSPPARPTGAPSADTLRWAATASCGT